ncbi:hypothetical protein [Aquella oligotrophica]|uniref:Lipoprotein n=1 Tax=Aquella oligotrophica TaxID=2067065 RepID=A0A2I7N369_9NEIS|nr:hypothetical protein [Aquella oligotrophica]AUR50904.1 hypothetical protein CUN60_00830 [Aquella oligotrophica]
MKKILFAVSILVSLNCLAATLAVPNLQLSSSAYTNNFISPDKPDSIDPVTQTELKQQISTFSAQIRGKIIQSKHFNVIDLNNNLLKVESPSSNTIIKPDYILTGVVSAIDTNEETKELSNTNMYSIIYSIDIAVDYKLVRTKDNHIIASFTAAGHGGDVKLTSNKNQKVSHNTPKLIQQAGEDLAAEVNNQLTLQLDNGKIIRDYQEAAPNTNEIKVYSNQES